jgi:hypothetical protein
VAARGRLDEQQAQLGRAVVAPHAHDAADPPAVELGDPDSFARRVDVRGVVGDDARDQCLIAGVPPELGGVQLGVTLDDPAEIAGARLAQYHHAATLVVRLHRTSQTDH